MIRDNDPKLKGLKEELFKESDFEDEDEDEESDDKKKKKSKPVTYKDLIREDVLNHKDGSESDSSDTKEDLFKRKNPKKETIAEEEARLKAEFKKAAKVDSEDD